MTTLYDLDSSRVPWHVYRSVRTLWQLPFVCYIKLFRVRLSGTCDDPPVETPSPFETTAESIPQEVRGQFAPLLEQLAALEFGQPLWHSIVVPHLATNIWWVTLLHPSGNVVARIHLRHWQAPGGMSDTFFTQFMSMMDDGTFVVTANRGKELLNPDSCNPFCHPNVDVPSLFELHSRYLDDALPRSPRAITHQDALRAMLEQHHALLRDYYVELGIFVPRPPAPVPEAAPTSEGEAAPLDPADAAVLDEIDKLQNKQSGWGSALAILMISLLLFVGTAKQRFDVATLGILIAVVFFHEMGHYLAMRWFGYRNLKMFFIPFFGAAVSGKHYNVPGWKKAVVSLMGPLPGIVLGVALTLAGIVTGIPLLLNVALLLLILNGLNLLPFLPLDGGQNLHAVLFSRHPFLDLLFRLMAIGGLIALGALSDSRIVICLALFMLIGVARAYRIARISHQLRQQKGIPVSPDDQRIPPAAAAPILAEVRKRMPRMDQPAILAGYVTQVFETLNARPPGLLASLALLIVHGGGLVVALVMAVVCMMAQHGDLEKLWRARAGQPRYTYKQGTTQLWAGMGAPRPPHSAPYVLTAIFAGDRTARQRFDTLPTELPPRASLRLFGESLLLSMPANDEGREIIAYWTRRFEGKARVLVIQRDFPYPAELSCGFADQATSKAIEEEVSDYFALSRMWRILAPWSAEWRELPLTERERYQSARSRLRRLNILAAQAQGDPRLDPFQEQLEALGASPDAKERSRILRKRQIQLAKVLEGLIREDAAKNSEGISPELTDLWLRWRAPSAWDAEEEANLAPEQWQAVRDEPEVLYSKLGSFLGQGSLAGKPGLSCDPVGRHPRACYHEKVERHGRSLAFQLVTFADPTEGLPSLAEWLYSRGASDLHYDFKAPAM